MKKKILVIEDEDLILLNIKKILELQGYTVITAEDGVAGIEKAFKLTPDLIFCDIMMPKLDGYNVLFELKKQRETKDIPFIFLSAKSDKTSIRQGMESGASDYIVKPFRIDELINAAKAQLSKKEQTEKYTQSKVKQFQTLFFQSLSHEFFTPLNGILGLSDILKNNISKYSDEKNKELVCAIHESGKRLYKTLSRLILYSKLSMQRDELIDRAETNNSIPPEIIINRAKLLARNYKRTNDIKISVKSKIPYLSEEHLLIILDEAINNAFKFSKPGCSVSVSTFNNSSFYIISILNQGSFFKSENENKIAPFVQFNKDEQAQQGVGLGLAIIKAITSTYNGTMKITSSINNETEIIIKIPITEI